MKSNGGNRRATASRLFFRMVNDISSNGRGGKTPGEGGQRVHSRPLRARSCKKFGDCASLEPTDPHEFNR